jgi:hypothetical protein
LSDDRSSIEIIKTIGNKVVYGYYKENVFITHRDNGPAIKFTNGDEIWYSHGTIHREAGPAILSFKREEWFFHGKRHRLDGFALIASNFSLYYVDNNFCESTKIYEEEVRKFKIKMFCK